MLFLFLRGIWSFILVSLFGLSILRVFHSRKHILLRLPSVPQKDYRDPCPLREVGGDFGVTVWSESYRRSRPFPRLPRTRVRLLFLLRYVYPQSRQTRYIWELWLWRKSFWGSSSEVWLFLSRCLRFCSFQGLFSLSLVFSRVFPTLVWNFLVEHLCCVLPRDLNTSTFPIGPDKESGMSFEWRDFLLAVFIILKVNFDNIPLCLTSS